MIRFPLVKHGNKWILSLSRSIYSDNSIASLLKEFPSLVSLKRKSQKNKIELLVKNKEIHVALDVGNFLLSHNRSV